MLPAAPATTTPIDYSAYKSASVDPTASATLPAPATSTPSVISSQTGAQIVGQQTQKLQALSSNPTTPTTVVTPPATSTSSPDYRTPQQKAADQGSIDAANKANATGTKYTPAPPVKVTLINPTTDQTITFDNADLNKDSIQSYLTNGYQMSDAAGAVPSWLSPNGVTDVPQTAAEKAQAEVDSAATDISNLSKNLSQFTISDAALKAQTDGITALWNARIDAMNSVNAQREGSINTLGIRLGDRYAGGKGGQFGSIISEEERQGVQRVADLEGQKQAAIAAAQAAAMSQNWSVYSKQVDMAQKAYDDKVAAMKTLQDATAAQNKTIFDQTEQLKKDTYDQVTKPINDVLMEAQKNAAPPDIINAINAAKTPGEAVAAAGSYLQSATGPLGDYLQYKRDTAAKGLTPMDYQSWSDGQAAKDLKDKVSLAYAQENAKIQADNASTGTDKVQQKLEQQYRQVLTKEFSARTGSLGVENAKVAQGNHLNSLFTKYYDPKTGNYNVPTAQYTELALGLANMLSTTGQSSDADRTEIKSKTAAGDFKGALQYITGEPQTGNTQAIIKNLIDSVDRQAATAVRNRQASLDNMKSLAPTDLEQSRVDALNKATNMVSYEGQARVSKSTVDNYVKQNPAEAENIAKLYEIPGATDQDIEAYLKAQGKITDTSNDFVPYLASATQ